VSKTERAPGIICVSLTCKNEQKVEPTKTFVPVSIGNGAKIISDRDNRRKTRSARKEEQRVKEITSDLEEVTVDKKSDYD
jgi:hypothetical protein